MAATQALFSCDVDAFTFVEPVPLRMCDTLTLVARNRKPLPLALLPVSGTEAAALPLVKLRRDKLTNVRPGRGRFRGERQRYLNVLVDDGALLHAAGTRRARFDLYRCDAVTLSTVRLAGVNLRYEVERGCRYDATLVRVCVNCIRPEDVGSSASAVFMLVCDSEHGGMRSAKFLLSWCKRDRRRQPETVELSSGTSS